MLSSKTTNYNLKQVAEILNMDAEILKLGNVILVEDTLRLVRNGHTIVNFVISKMEIIAVGYFHGFHVNTTEFINDEIDIVNFAGSIFNMIYDFRMMATYAYEGFIKDRLRYYSLKDDQSVKVTLVDLNQLDIEIVDRFMKENIVINLKHPLSDFVQNCRDISDYIRKWYLLYHNK